MMQCRSGCGACCIAPSISSPIPGMPGGKPAGVRCIQLTTDNLCRIFGMDERPAVCSGLRPGAEMCGRSSAEAMAYLAELEQSTRPAADRAETLSFASPESLPNA
ncbi:MAG TPA: YkgJ family cysteine cluster protein [Desulfuromonadales bacterium]|nr:YkgJ family cysteine cluster protein [Desulfuromonadales bacterium]